MLYVNFRPLWDAVIELLVWVFHYFRNPNNGMIASEINVFPCCHRSHARGMDNKEFWRVFHEHLEMVAGMAGKSCRFLLKVLAAEMVCDKNASSHLSQKNNCRKAMNSRWMGRELSRAAMSLKVGTWGSCFWSSWSWPQNPTRGRTSPTSATCCGNLWSSFLTGWNHTTGNWAPCCSGSLGQSKTAWWKNVL